MKSSDKQLEESSWSCSHNNQFETPKELHDITEQFLEVFQNSEFPTFESLKVALGEFSRKTGFIYTVKRSKRYRENDIRRHGLVYNNICYGCTLHVQGTSNSVKQNEAPCSSAINFTSVKGAFRVAKFSMVHNHPPPRIALNLGIHPPVFPAFIDCGDSFRQAFPLMSAGSYSELAARLKHFEKKTGSVYIKYSTGLFSDTVDLQEVRCKYKKIRYVCVHYGSRKSEPIRRRNQHTTKIGCGSCFSVKYKDGRLHIVNYDMRHCHPVDPESARLYPHNRRLSPVETAEIEELLDVNANINEVKRIIKERYGKICTTRDIINMRFRRRKNLERQINVEQSALSYSSNRHRHQEQHSTRSDLEPLAEVCCRLVLDDEEEVEEEEDTCTPPVLQDAQQICEQQTATAGDEQVDVSVHSILRNLTQVWRQNRNEKDRNLRYNNA